ncbi:MAG: oligopeptide transporter, OPT family [Acidobacteriota bacterium]
MSDIEPGAHRPHYKPYVPEETDLPELTLRALLPGIALAAILGAANAYVGMKAGLTVAATFPAAVIALALMRTLGGSILEENIIRTTASVGEALVAGAIFTVPAFVLVGYWDNLLTPANYLEGSLLLLVGGVLGVLFVIVLRRALVSESDLPFPESVAAASIHKAGQKGATGAGLVFGAMGVSMLLELFKNGTGIVMIRERITGFWQFSRSMVPLGEGKAAFGGGMAWSTPAASPMLMGVGYVIGPRLASINFSGGLLAWGFLVPLILFVNGPDGVLAELGGAEGWRTAAEQAWFNIVRPIAVGAMLVGAFWTLWGMRQQIVSGITKAISDLRAMKAGTGRPSRLEHDLPVTLIGILIGLMVIPTFFVYLHFTGAVVTAAVAAVVMVAAGFLFVAVAGYLVGLIGSSSNPISGLTLSTLIIAAGLMVLMGQTGAGGVAAVLGVAAVVCCACGIGGDMIQDLKVGHILGGTPRRMQVAEMISVVIVAFVLIAPIGYLHAADVQQGGVGIGGEGLPAPQAGLMAMLSQGIIGGEMAWPLVIVGMLFSVGLILVKAPSPMLIAVGMYLPLQSTFAIFIGGLFRWAAEAVMRRRGGDAEEIETASNRGVLVASGLIAGEALTAVGLAVYVIISGSTTAVANVFDEHSIPATLLMLGLFALVGWMLIAPTLRAFRAQRASD